MMQILDGIPAKIAYNDLDRKVLLTDGRKGEVLLINNTMYSSPMVRLADESAVDLSPNHSVSIQSLLS